MDDRLDRIQAAIRGGSLPSVDCLVTWYGAGQGQVCAACAERILGSELVLECDLPGGTMLRLHARCYELWQSAREP